MKKLVASLLIFTIGFGVNSLYCKAETEPTDNVAQTSTIVKPKDDKTQYNENKDTETKVGKPNENKTVEPKDEKAILQQKLKELIKKEEDKEKLKKKILIRIEATSKYVVMCPIAFFTLPFVVSFSIAALLFDIGKLIIT